MTGLVPGEVLRDDESVTINEGRQTTTVSVENTGDRPVQVGSHVHFFEVNPGLAFDREAAYGMRLNVPAGTAARFEPGMERDVELVAIGGDRVVYGMGGLVNGPLDAAGAKAKALERAYEAGYVRSEPDVTELEDEAEAGTDEGDGGLTEVGDDA